MHEAILNKASGRLEIFLGDRLVPRLCGAANLMQETRLASSTVMPYLRGTLALFDQEIRAATRPAPGRSPWGPPDEVRALMEDTLRHMGASLEISLVEPGVVSVYVNPEHHDRVARLVFGSPHFYEALIRAGHYAYPNPFVIPVNQRRPAVIPRTVGVRGREGASWRDARLYFRLVDRNQAGPRMDDPDMIGRILPALAAYGVPAPIWQLFATQIEGLARISEEVRLSLLDWWRPSASFGTTIATSNKGSRRIATKIQVITPQRCGGLRQYGNGERVEYDRARRTLDDYETIMRDGSIPLVRRQAILAAEPLFPRQDGDFYASASGVVDVHYRPAMKEAGLITRTHYIRHSGVNMYFEYVDGLDISRADKREMKLSFGVHMGWAWPEIMLDWYSGPARQREQIANAEAWLAARDSAAAVARTAVATPAPPFAPISSDRALSEFARLRALAA